jgi:hypothetical protein
LYVIFRNQLEAPDWPEKLFNSCSINLSLPIHGETNEEVMSKWGLCDSRSYVKGASELR